MSAAVSRIWRCFFAAAVSSTPCAKKTKSACSVVLDPPPKTSAENLNRPSTSSKDLIAVFEVVERHQPLALHQFAEKFFGRVVRGDARGDEQTDQAVGGDQRAGQFGKEHVEVDVALAGERVTARNRGHSRAFSARGHGPRGKRRATPGWRWASAAMRFFRSPALTAPAVAGSVREKNSRSCTLTRSQGGLPMTQSKPGLGRRENGGKCRFPTHRHGTFPGIGMVLANHFLVADQAVAPDDVPDRSASVWPLRAERIQRASCVISTACSERSTPYRL